MLDADIAARWFAWPNIAYVTPVPLLVAALAAGIYWALMTPQGDVAVSVGARPVRVVLRWSGNQPLSYIVPRSITIWQASAPEASLVFMLVGTAVLSPLILAYTGHAYWVFRGKVKMGEGYH